ncbi:hypothetical protein BDP27DRAFT_1244249, partial [Rhodocollybia butyracea]
VLEREKHKNLNKTQHTTSTPHNHAPGWNKHLASTSEAYGSSWPCSLILKADIRATWQLANWLGSYWYVKGARKQPNKYKTVPNQTINLF